MSIEKKYVFKGLDVDCF